MPGTETPQTIKLNYKIWLSTPDERGIMGDGKWQILKAIETHGSLRAATKALGITYRRTWGDLKAIEETLGVNLLEKTRGGKEGGQSQLTPEGIALVEAFDDLHAKADAFMEQLFSEFHRKIQGVLNG